MDTYLEMFNYINFDQCVHTVLHTVLQPLYVISAKMVKFVR